MARVLLIEDEATLRTTVRKVLTRAGHEVTDVETVPAARQQVQVQDFDLVLTDIMLGTDNGLEFVKELRSREEGGLGFDGPVVVMTAFSTVESAVLALRLGADDYLQKPISLEELSIQVERWLEHRRLQRELLLYQRLERSRQVEHELVGSSPAWQSALGVATKLAGLPLPSGATGESPRPLPCILLTGETGAGKGVLARHIHACAQSRAAETGDAKGAGSGVAPLPLIHVNCSALPTNLVEGELFGHERGAFTDAREARPGLFEMAEGGTMFLDEISEMPLELQAKLLLVLEHGRYRRVGGRRERFVRARVIAASNQNLAERVEAGQFRRDLFYRLNAFTIRVPSLRERGEDALLIAEQVLERSGLEFRRPGLRFTAGARQAIREHGWPGNVRELVNAVHRAVMLGESSQVDEADLGIAPGSLEERGEVSAGGVFVNSSQSQGPRMSGTASSNLTFNFESGTHKYADVERELIMQALRHTRGNVSRAAKLIGMQRSSLRYRIERYQLDRFVLEVASP